METKMLPDFIDRTQSLMTQARYLVEAVRGHATEYLAMGYGELPPNAFAPEGMSKEELQGAMSAMQAVLELFDGNPALLRGVYLAQRRNR